MECSSLLPLFFFTHSARRQQKKRRQQAAALHKNIALEELCKPVGWTADREASAPSIDDRNRAGDSAVGSRDAVAAGVVLDVWRPAGQ